MSSGFSAADKQAMLALTGVGATVISRLEQIGFNALSQLADEDPAAITLRIAQMMGSACWHNSPQARQAITSIIALARARQT